MSSFAAGDALGLHHCPARAIAGCKILVRNAIGAALGVSQQPRGSWIVPVSVRAGWAFPKINGSARPEVQPPPPFRPRNATITTVP